MQISDQAAIFLGLETLLFLGLLLSIWKARRKLQPNLKGLARSLRLSEDQFGDESNFVTSARTRYRRAAENIEEVDAHSIAASELSSYELLHIGKWRVNIGGLSELMGSAPGVFITIGLLGTFVGLAANLQELGLLLTPTDDTAPGEIVDQLGNVLGPMSTAFLSSLGGVFYSLLFWLIGLVLGCNRLLEETESLLTAYLEQVVQADCNRFSLVRASVERMELCLSNFMSRFSDEVGQAIERAMNEKIKETFDSIQRGSKAMSLYAETFSEGVQNLDQSGRQFKRASEAFSSSEFAKDFSNASNAFLLGINNGKEALTSFVADLDYSSEGYKEALKGYQDSYMLLDSLKGRIEEYNSLVEREIDTQDRAIEKISKVGDDISEAAKQLRSARLEIGRENKTTNELSASLAKKLSAEDRQREETLLALRSLQETLTGLTKESERTKQLVETHLRTSSLTDEERRRLNALSEALLSQSNTETWE